jgi:hypothetical protein
MGEGTVGCCLVVPVGIVADDTRLVGLLTQALDQIAAETGTVGWRLQGTPTVFIMSPEHAVAFGLDVTLPEAPAPGDYLAVVVTVDAVDELDALLTR